MFGIKKRINAENDFTPFNAIVNTKHSSLFIRAGSSKVLRNISSAPKGARLTVYGDDGSWYKVMYRGTKGFAHKDYVLKLD